MGQVNSRDHLPKWTGLTTKAKANLKKKSVSRVAGGQKKSQSGGRDFFFFFQGSVEGWGPLPVSEIKLLFCALAGCTSHKTVHPKIASCTLPINSNTKWLKKRAHTGCISPKIVHPAVEMCTPGAGCTLNFGHCQLLNYRFLKLNTRAILNNGCSLP